MFCFSKLCIRFTTDFKAFKISTIIFHADKLHDLIEQQNVMKPPPLLHNVTMDVIYTAGSKITQILCRNMLFNIPCKLWKE